MSESTTENFNFSKALKHLSINKEDLVKLCELLELGQPEVFTPADMDNLSELVKRKEAGAESYAQAYAQMQAEVVAVETQTVEQPSDNPTAETIYQKADALAKEDLMAALAQIADSREDMGEAFRVAYMNSINRLLNSPEFVRILETAQPQSLPKKPFTSYVRARIAAENQQALPQTTQN